jgi:uncharacterized protein with GYD domain
MKNISKLAAIALVVLVGTPIAFAQTSAVTPAAGLRQNKDTVREEIKTIKTRAQEAASSTRNDLKTKMETAREQIQNKKQEFQNNIENRKIALLTNWGTKTIKRLEEATARLDKLTVRIESRIAKMKANKIDTTQADASLVIAKQKVADAKTALAAAKLAITEIGNQASGTITASTTKTILGQNLQKIKEQVRIVTEALKAAHKALVETVSELKGKEGTKTATSTKPVETE